MLDDMSVCHCILEIFPDLIMNRKNPIILVVKVLEGILKIGTPITTDKVYLGPITDIRSGDGKIKEAGVNRQVCVVIGSDENLSYDPQSNPTGILYSQVI